VAIKGLALFSGGLDSSLAAKLAQNAGIAVTALYFTAPFIPVSHERGPWNAAEQLGIRLIVRPIGLDYLEILKRPRYGFGKNANPCVDCKIYMYSRAKEIMDELEFDVLITGEVLDQRPMTQKPSTLKLIEREAGLEDRVIRPLSAKLLEPTSIEVEGRVDRKAFASIRGRSRKPQIELAERFGLSSYPTPAGGCLLTDPGFARRILDLLDNDEDVTFKDINLLKHGRHFRLESSKVIIGRNEQENGYLEGRRSWAQAYLWPIGFTGPVALVFGNPTKDERLWTARAIARYGKRAHYVKVGQLYLGRECHIQIDEPLEDEELKGRVL